MDVCGLRKFRGRYLCASSYLGHCPRIARRELADGMEFALRRRNVYYCQVTFMSLTPEYRFVPGEPPAASHQGIP